MGVFRQVISTLENGVDIMNPKILAFHHRIPILSMAVFSR